MAAVDLVRADMNELFDAGLVCGIDKNMATVGVGSREVQGAPEGIV